MASKHECVLQDQLSFRLDHIWIHHVSISIQKCALHCSVPPCKNHIYQYLTCDSWKGNLGTCYTKQSIRKIIDSWFLKAARYFSGQCMDKGVGKASVHYSNWLNGCLNGVFVWRKFQSLFWMELTSEIERCCLMELTDIKFELKYGKTALS